MNKRMFLLTAILAVMQVAGAEYDKGATYYLDDVLYLEGAAYRTPANPSTVADFYVKQGIAPVKGKANAHGVFKKDDVLVTIQCPPRKDMTTGEKASDTLMTIAKED